MVIEDCAGHRQQLRDEGIAQCVSHGRSELSGRHDVLAPEDGQLLRDDRLLEAPAAERELVTTIDSLLHGSSNGVVAYNSTVDGGIVLMDPNTGRKELLTRHGPAGGFAQGRPDRVQPSG